MVVLVKLDGERAGPQPELCDAVRVLAPTAGPVLCWIGEALSPSSRWHEHLIVFLLPCPFKHSEGLMLREGVLHPGNQSISRERRCLGRLIGVRSLDGPL